MYLIHPNIAEVNGAQNYADVAPGSRSGCSGCKCGGKCKKAKGVGDISTFFSTGDFSQLLTDPATGSTSWSTVAILALIGVTGFMVATGRIGSLGIGTERQAALATARAGYQREVRNIRKKYGVFS
jgi:hypothetical protein